MVHNLLIVKKLFEHVVSKKIARKYNTFIDSKYWMWLLKLGSHNPSANIGCMLAFLFIMRADDEWVLKRQSISKSQIIINKPKKSLLRQLKYWTTLRNEEIGEMCLRNYQMNDEYYEQNPVAHNQSSSVRQ